jgi:hypothetical protein
MAVNSIIQIRNSPAAQWLLANPILSLGEIGWERDTGLYKVGDGISAWTALSYGGVSGSAPTIVNEDFGSGFDGNLTLSYGVLTLTRDFYFNNLTINGTGSIYTAGYRIFVAGILDITAASVSAIQFNGSMANPGLPTGVAGAVPPAQVSNTIGGPVTGSAGGVGNVGLGANGGAGIGAVANGGAGVSSGGGGAGNGNNGGNGAAGGVVASSLPIRVWTLELIKGITLIQGAAGSAGGGGGGGDGTNKGGGGGGAGNGGGVVAIYANIINRGSGTPAACISANGATGGNGGSPITGITGGGGGGGGGSGGWVVIFYNTLTGTSATSAISANGGNGGTGGNGFGGNGTTTGLGGSGGGGGGGGMVNLLQVTTGTGTNLSGSGAGTGGSSQSGGTGGAGGFGTTLEVSL